jgi:hypothetical protein
VRNILEKSRVESYHAWTEFRKIRRGRTSVIALGKLFQAP